MKQKNNQKAQELLISEEEKQNHPFVRSIAKKIRNINKKILDIETLQKRDDLKPEQQEKINSKQSTIDERKKFEDFVRFYRATIAEAANDKQAKQVSPVFSKLGNSLVLSHYLSKGAQIDGLNLNAVQKNIISNLANVGRQEGSLQELGAQLGGYFCQYLNNEKLVTKVETAFSNQKIGKTKVNLYQKNQNQTQPQKIEVKQNLLKQQIQQIKIEKQPIQNLEQPPIEQTKDSNVVVSQQQPKNEVVNVVENTTEVQPQVSGQIIKQEYKRGQKDRPYKPYQTNKRPYKPKYNQKKQDGDEQQLDDEQVERSRFNNKEMRELENDGFIVIQKKQKPKDPKESENYYKKQHGYKQKRNYHNN